MAVKKPYPRSTLKKIIKAHSNRKITKNVDILVFLNYTLFVQNLMQEACINAKESKRRKITADDVREVTKRSLKKFKA